MYNVSHGSATTATCIKMYQHVSSMMVRLERKSSVANRSRFPSRGHDVQGKSAASRQVFSKTMQVFSQNHAGARLRNAVEKFPIPLPLRTDQSHDS